MKDLEWKESTFPEYYKEISDQLCPICDGEMTKGDEECMGYCIKCFNDAMNEAEANDND